MKVLPRILKPLTVVLGATPVAIHSVNEEAPNKKLPQLVRPSELPIYDVECDCQHTLMDSFPVKEKSVLEKRIMDIRVALIEVLGSFEGSKDRVVQFMEVGKAHTLDTIEYLREESNVLARIGAISVGGLSGLVLGIRGGAFKKLFYAGIGTSTVASLCYPQTATQICKSGLTIAKYYSIIGYNKIQEEFNERRKAKTQPLSPPKVPSLEKIGEQGNVTSLNAQIETKPQKVINNPPLIKGDYGQSNPEDHDLYTTRN